MLKSKKFTDLYWFVISAFPGRTLLKLSKMWSINPATFIFQNILCKLYSMQKA